MTSSSTRRTQQRTIGDERRAIGYGGHILRCHPVTDEELVALAETVDRILVHQVGPNAIPRSEISRLTTPLETLAWPHHELVTNRNRLREDLVKKISDRRRRLRVRTGRHILAGITANPEGGLNSKALLLVFLRKPGKTFDLQLAA